MVLQAVSHCYHPHLKTRYTLIVLASSGLILGLTGVAKLWSALGTSRALIIADPLLGISYEHLLAVVAVIEIVAATLCFFGRSREVAVASVAYLSTNFLIYRIGLWWIGWKQPCGCMGSLTDALHIRPQTADHIALVLLIYMATASYALLFRQWRSEQKYIGGLATPAGGASQ